MSEACGKMLFCDVCGDSVFLQTIGDGEADGGYTRWKKFEAAPEGWGLVEVPMNPEKFKEHSIRVCPTCHSLWAKVLNEHLLAVRREK